MRPTIKAPIVISIFFPHLLDVSVNALSQKDWEKCGH